MEAAFAELPLAVFTTLAPVGAGAYLALAMAFSLADLTDGQLRKIDRLTLIPFAVVLAGFAASFAHLASPLHAMGVFGGLGSSPLSNEIAVGSVFVTVALVYTVLAFVGKLSVGARKVFSGAVAILGIVFALFTGMAYLMDTIASWNTPFVPGQMIGFALTGGMLLGTYVIALGGGLGTVLKGSFKGMALGVVAAGTFLAAAGFAAQMAYTASLGNAIHAGADLVSGVVAYAVVAVVLIVAAGVLEILVLRGKQSVTLLLAGTVLAVAGIFLARLAFYAVQLSVGLSLL